MYVLVVTFDQCRIVNHRPLPMAGLAIVIGVHTLMTGIKTIAHRLYRPIVVGRQTITRERLPRQCRESVPVIATVSFETIVALAMVGVTTIY